ncbi:hypothetical protein [Salinibaculum rarum]|uniref:hypothetical protein n=1 Tax=Salinibaculum rarum TaxID=3058903 RepID=UPI00265E09E8|nr:hypothetical protein [Salinibaculum sp. KK48]
MIDSKQKESTNRNHSPRCSGCNELIVPGEKRRPSDEGTVHDECAGLVHTPQDDSPRYKFALIFTTSKLRIFKQPPSPLRPGRFNNSDWGLVDTIAEYNHSKIDIEGGKFAHERGVTILYAEDITQHHS